MIFVKFLVFYSGEYNDIQIIKDVVYICFLENFF